VRWLTSSTVATWQGLDRSVDRIYKFDPENFILVIVDEAHHGASPQYVSRRDGGCACDRLTRSFTRVLHYFNCEVPLHGGVQPIEE
jgi:type I site-specific restriction endonuclease